MRAPAASACAITARTSSREATPRPPPEPQAALKVEEGVGIVLELATHRPVGLEAKAFGIEGDRAVEIVHPKGDQRNSRLHAGSPRFVAAGAEPMAIVTAI